MFVATFYSYKGGVGRTLAVANVAVELSRRGKSVLVADFDLEAPGLSSFSFGHCALSADKRPGLVEFIGDWLGKGKTPDIRDFVYQHVSNNPEHGPIWVMPAGRVDDTYSGRLQRIDFGELYEQHDGFLLFEDIKAQWRKAIKADYVLIDSRTGHTDVGGICTRQLPDLVVFLFWPNVQNLDGLSAVIHEMDQEDASRNIERIFVPANLPTLDDEEEVLRDLLRKFRRELGYDASQQVLIFNYPSLDLLQQKIFTAERPRSRLARDYGRLTDTLMARNLSDEHGVRLFLQNIVNVNRQGLGRIMRRESFPVSGRDERQLEGLFRREWRDHAINRVLAAIKATENEFSAAIQLMVKVIAVARDTLPDHLNLAEWMIAGGVDVDPSTTINRLLNDDDSTQRHVTAALRLIARFDGSAPRDLESRPAIRKLTPQQLARIASTLVDNRVQTLLLSGLIQSLVRQSEVEMKTLSAIPFAVSLISSGNYDDAIDLLGRSQGSEPKDSLRIAFNLAMATWGRDGKPLKDMFETTLSIREKLSEPEDGANYLQCLGLAYGVVGQTGKAFDYLEKARLAISKDTSAVSCWSYLNRGEFAFVTETSEIRRWIEIGIPEPLFLRENARS